MWGFLSQKKSYSGTQSETWRFLYRDVGKRIGNLYCTLQSTWSIGILHEWEIMLSYEDANWDDSFTAHSVFNWYGFEDQIGIGITSVYWFNDCKSHFWWLIAFPGFSNRERMPSWKTAVRLRLFLDVKIAKQNKTQQKNLETSFEIHERQQN